MGCNCGKRTRVPSQRLPGRQAPPPPPPPAPSTTESQNVRARQANGVTQSFTLERVDGSVQTFGSRLEAEAERIRGGGGRIV